MKPGSTNYEFITDRDLTPLEHRVIGSTVAVSYAVNSDIPQSVQDGALLEEIVQRRHKERQINDFASGLSITKQLLAAVIGLGEYDQETGKILSPTLIGFYAEDEESVRVPTSEEKQKFMDYLEERRKELAEAIIPREGEDTTR